MITHVAIGPKLANPVVVGQEQRRQEQGLEGLGTLHALSSLAACEQLSMLVGLEGGVLLEPVELLLVGAREPGWEQPQDMKLIWYS